MSAPALAVLPGGRPDERSWEEMLLEAVEPEFRVDVYHAVPGDPVLHGPTCAVGGCPGRGVNRSLGLNAGGENRSTGTRFRGYVCLAHVDMWRRDGEPPINVWVRQTARALKGQARPDRCRAPGGYQQRQRWHGDRPARNHRPSAQRAPFRRPGDPRARYRS